MAEGGDLLVEVLGHAGDLRLGQRVDAQGLDELVHAAGGDPGEVAVGHDGDQGRLGPLAALQKPLREIRTRAQLRDRDVDGAHAGVQRSVAVAVAVVSALSRAGVPLGPAHGVGVRGQQGVDHGLQQLAHQIRRCISQGFAK